MADISEYVWTEKYRPDTLGDVRGNETIVNRLSEWVNDPSMPNLLFAGPQGTGKTAMAVAFAKDKYGDEWQQHFKSLNASDDRGIDVVRDEIKEFAQVGVVGEYEYKVIFLDESDALTRDAQPALRRVMEQYSDRTRFILSCNYPNQIIDPLLSRTTVFRVDPLGTDEMVSLLSYVADAEDVRYSIDQIESIAQMVDGDGRSGIHALQAAVIDGEISDDMLEEMTVYPTLEQVATIVDLALTGQTEAAMEMVSDMLNDGVDPSDLCDEFVSVVKRTDGIPEDGKVKIIDKIAETEWRVLNGSNPLVQFNSLVANVRVAQALSLEPYRRADE